MPLLSARLAWFNDGRRELSLCMLLVKCCWDVINIMHIALYTGKALVVPSRSAVLRPSREISAVQGGGGDTVAFLIESENEDIKTLPVLQTLLN